jgi:hypothetical protein
MHIQTQQLYPHSIKSINFEYSLIGFGSTIIHMLGTFEYCKKYEIDFNFNEQNIIKLYNDNSNIWNKIYKPDCLRLNFNHSRKYEIKNSLPYVIPFFNYLDCCDDNTFFISKKWSSIFNDILQNYLDYNDDFKIYVENKIKFLKNENFFGVHLRGTDMEEHGKLSSIEEKIDQIECEFDNSKLDKIFIMTDENYILNLMRNKFKDKVIYLDFIERSMDKSPLHHHRKKQNGEKILVDLLIEISAMANAKKMFYSRSGVSALICSLNPEIPYVLPDDNLKNHDLMHWKHKLYNNFDIEYSEKTL